MRTNADPAPPPNGRGRSTAGAIPALACGGPRRPRSPAPASAPARAARLPRWPAPATRSGGPGTPCRTTASARRRPRRTPAAVRPRSFAEVRSPSGRRSTTPTRTGGTAGSVRGDVGGGLQTARPGWFRTGPSNTPRATLLLNSRGASTRERESSRGLLPVGREQPWGLPSDPEIRLQDRERGGRAGKRRNPHPHGTFRDLGGGPPEGPTRKPKRRRVSAAASVTPYPQPARTDSRPLQRSSLHLLSVDARRSPLARIKRPHGPYMLLPFLGIPLKMGIAGKPSLFPLWTMHAP